MGSGSVRTFPGRPVNHRDRLVVARHGNVENDFRKPALFPNIL